MVIFRIAILSSEPVVFVVFIGWDQKLISMLNKCFDIGKTILSIFAVNL